MSKTLIGLKSEWMKLVRMVYDLKILFAENRYGPSQAYILKMELKEKELKFKDEIRELNSQIWRRRAGELGVGEPSDPEDGDENWQESEFSQQTELTNEGLAKLKKAVRHEEAQLRAEWDAKWRWLIPIWTVIASTIAAVASFLNWIINI